MFTLFNEIWIGDFGDKKGQKIAVFRACMLVLKDLLLEISVHTVQCSYTMKSEIIGRFSGTKKGKKSSVFRVRVVECFKDR